MHKLRQQEEHVLHSCVDNNGHGNTPVLLAMTLACCCPGAQASAAGGAGARQQAQAAQSPGTGAHSGADRPDPASSQVTEPSCPLQISLRQWRCYIPAAAVYQAPAGLCVPQNPAQLSSLSTVKIHAVGGVMQWCDGSTYVKQWVWWQCICNAMGTMTVHMQCNECDGCA